MSNEKCKPVLLKFLCPECQNNHLECCESDADITSRISLLSDNGDFSYDVPTIHDSTVVAFQCTDCGYRPLNNHGCEISDNLELVEWLKKQEYNK